METEKGDVATIIFMMALLTFAIVIVDERWLRAAIAFVPAMLIVQRALAGARAGPAGGPRTRAGTADRREDTEVRAYIEELLQHFREFYSTCHLMASGLIEPEDAERRSGQLEKELNQLLARVMEAAKRGAGV